ncbi:MAG TPA: cytochrome c maturation protein CcmE [Steroidobacteraceae bacterium]
MTPVQRRRLFLVLGILIGVGASGALALRALRDNVMFYFNPSQVVAGQAPTNERLRLGGIVKHGSVQRTPGTLDVQFVVSDFKDLTSDVPVKYSGVLPDLFREGQGVVAEGRLSEDGTLIADRVLAKHDENYMPPHAEHPPKTAGASPEGT